MTYGTPGAGWKRGLIEVGVFVFKAPIIRGQHDAPFLGHPLSGKGVVHGALGLQLGGRGCAATVAPIRDRRSGLQPQARLVASKPVEASQLPTQLSF